MFHWFYEWSTLHVRTTFSFLSLRWMLCSKTWCVVRHTLTIVRFFLSWHLTPRYSSKTTRDYGMNFSIRLLVPKKAHFCLKFSKNKTKPSKSNPVVKVSGCYQYLFHETKWFFGLSSEVLGSIGSSLFVQ